MEVRAALILAFALALLAPAAHADEPGASTMRLEDAAGDARVRNADSVVAAAWGHCLWFAAPVGVPCDALGAYGAIPADFASIGLPAPPSLDLVGAELSETPEALLVTFQIASLDASFSGAADEDGANAYVACWGPFEAYECAYLSVYEVGDALVLESSYDRFDGECNDWWWCTRHVDHVVEPGSPGRILLTIPRDIMAASDAGGTLTQPIAGVVHVGTAPGCCLSLRADLPTGSYATYRRSTIYAYDNAAFDAEFTFSLPRVGTEFSAEPWIESPADGVSVPSVDIVRHGIVETPDSIQVVTELALVEEVPADHGFFATFSVSSSPTVYQMWYDARNGTRLPSAGYCEDAGDAGSCAWTTIPVGLDISGGSPGWVNFTFARGDLRGIRPGDVTTMLWAAAGVPGSLVERSIPGAFVAYDSTADPAEDWTAGAPAFRFGVPPAQAVPGPATFVADPQRDTTLPPTVTASYAAQFDITGIEIEGSSPTTTRVVLGVADLGQVLVPLGYDAVFYVVGFRTDFGDVMVGYHKNSQNRGSSQEFFCSQDVAAFAQTPTDPMEIVRVPIEGMIAIASGGSDRARATGGGAGAIQFTVPHECFDPDLEGPFEASAVAAGTFLVQNPAGQGLAVQRVDAAAADGPVTLGALAPSPGDGPSWLSRPFGVENFWDMFGIAAAVATSAVGIGIVQRRRGILKKYLAAIDAAVAENADGGAREAALRQIRADLKRDLVRGAISEGHFVIVERRLDEHLSKARLAALTDAFDDLPHTLLQKLQELLSDGEMRKDEYRLFCTHLERTRLTEDAKEDIRRRVALWVVEDAAVGTGDAGAKA